MPSFGTGPPVSVNPSGLGFAGGGGGGAHDDLEAEGFDFVFLAAQFGHQGIAHLGGVEETGVLGAQVLALGQTERLVALFEQGGGLGGQFLGLEPVRLSGAEEGLDHGYDGGLQWTGARGGGFPPGMLGEDGFQQLDGLVGVGGGQDDADGGSRACSLILSRNESGDDVNHGEEGERVFFVASGDAAELF